MCLDTHAFRLTRSPREAFGCLPDRQRGHLDISASRADVEDASIWHASFPKWTVDPFTQAVVQPVGPTEDENDEEMQDSEEVVEDPSEPFLFEPDVVESESSADVLQEVDDTDSSSGTEQSIGEEPSDSPLVSLNDDVAIQLETSPPRPPVQTSPKPKEVWMSISDKVSDLRSPRFAVLHTSESDIRFLRNPMEDQTIALFKPLHQNLPPSLQGLDEFGRLNMLAQIPELGIVAVATQTGRVALLTLTQIASNKHLAFRLDAILPFHSQESQGHRPNKPLLGLAVGPIQGRELMLGSDESGSLNGNDRGESWRGVESSRRYRLMLTYYDHTILSYELERPSEATNNAQDALFAL